MVSRKPWSLEAAARLFITVILTLFFGMFLAGLVETPKLHWSREQRDFTQLILMTVFFQLSTLVWIGLLLLAHDRLPEVMPSGTAAWIRLRMRAHGVSWREAFFAGGRRWRALGIGLCAGAISAPALVLLQDGLTTLAKKYLNLNLEAQELVEKLQSPTISVAAKILVGVTAVVVAPMAEEALFRGVLYPTIKQQGRPVLALWFTSILFAASHASLMAFVPLMLFSMILIWLYEYCDNLLAPIMAHCALNAVNYYWIVTSSAGATPSH